MALNETPLSAAPGQLLKYDIRLPKRKNTGGSGGGSGVILSDKTEPLTFRTWDKGFCESRENFHL